MIKLISILFALVISSGSDFNSQLRNYLDEKFHSFVSYEYQVLQMPKNYSKIEINQEKTFRVSKNYAYIPVNVFDEKNKMSSSLITLRVKLFNKVFTAVHDIKKDEMLSTNNVKTKVEDVSVYNTSVVNISTDLNNYKSKVLIKEGTVLFENMIETIPVINKGDKIVLHSSGAGVDISLDAVSRQSGKVGDVISVYAQGSGIYKGKIIDEKNLTLVE